MLRLYTTYFSIQKEYLTKINQDNLIKSTDIFTIKLQKTLFTKIQRG